MYTDKNKFSTVYLQALIKRFISAGSAVFVINYTGDRLNFGLAVERFNASREKEVSVRMPSF